MERKELVLENVAPGEVAAELYEEYLGKGWRLVDQEVLASKEGTMDLKVILEKDE